MFENHKKVAFNIASEASYVVKQCYQTADFIGQKLMENAKNCKNFKRDILGDFQTLCSSASRYSNYRFSSRQKIARIFALVWWLTFFLGIWNQTDWRFEEEFLLGWVRRIAAPPQCEAPAPKNFNSTWGQFQYLFQSSKKSFQTF